MLRIVIHPANLQDREGAAPVLNRRTRRRFPFIEVIFADQRYQGAKEADIIAKSGTWRFEIVRRAPGAKGFGVLFKRWIVGRALSRIRRNRRLARDVEHLASPAEAFVNLAMIKIMPNIPKSADTTEAGVV